MSKAYRDEGLSNKKPSVDHEIIREGAVSFFVSTEIESMNPYGPYHNRDFISSIEKGYFVEQIEFQLREMGFETVGKKDVLEVKKGDSVIEYKFNISAKNLDSILKLNPVYSGYRNEGSILQLVKDFSLKPGSIMLWPLYPLDEEGKIFSVMAAGCQVTELPTLQLMRLLPNYESEILPSHKEKGFKFHWVPEEVKSGLLLSQDKVSNILEKIFQDNGVKVTEEHYDCFYQNPDKLQIENSAKMHGVRVVPMDENAQDFYALYGNISKEDLRHCASLEVDVVTFLGAIQEYQNKLKLDKRYSQDRITEIENAIANAGLMIEIERARREGSPNSVLHSTVASEFQARECTISKGSRQL